MKWFIYKNYKIVKEVWIIQIKLFKTNQLKKNKDI